MTRATLVLALGAALLFLAPTATAQSPPAVITVVFSADDMGFSVTSSKDISNVIVVLCDDSQHKHEFVLQSHFFNHTEADEVVGVYVKSGNNGIAGNDPPGAGQFFPNAGVSCSETSTSTSETTTSTSDTETSTSDTDTTTSDTDTTTSDSNTTTDPATEIPVFGTATTLALGIGGALVGSLLMLRRRL